MNKKPDLRVYQPRAFDWSDYYNVIEVKHIEDAQWVGHHGGADIHPSIYGHKNSRSHCGEYQIARDRAEIALMEKAIKLGIPQFGNCRSHQLANVVNGGTMIQHVNHGGSHILTTYDGRQILSNSIHHQMVNPYLLQTGVNKSNFEVLAWTNISNVHIGQEGTELEFEEGQHSEIEAMYMPDINFISIQGHFDFCGNYPDYYAFIKKIIFEKGMLKLN